MDIAALGFEIDSTPARTAAGDLDKLAAAATKTETAAKKLSVASRDLLRDENGRFMNAAKAAEKYGAEVESLRMKYNPLYAASRQFEAQQGELQRALALGAISATQYENALATLQAGMVRSGGAAGGFSHEMSNASMHSANVFAQLNDIGMMMAAGQSPLMLALQQGTQLNQVWGQMGGNVSSIKSVLLDAFTSLLNPVNLLTIGLIAGGAALVQWGMSALGAGANTKTFQENVDAAQSAIDELNGIVKLYSEDGLEQLKQQYGEVNAEVLQLVQNQKLLALADAAKAVDDVIASMNQSLGDGLFSTAYGDIESIFDVASNDAQILYGVISSIGDLDSLEKQRATVRRLTDQLSIATDGFTNMTSEQIEMLRVLTNAENEMRKLAKAASDANNSDMSNLVSEIDQVRSAAQSAAAYVAMLSQTGQSSGPDSARTKLWGGGAFAPPVMGAGLPTPKTPGGGGGGGGGGSDPFADNLTRLVESLQTERETVDAWYQENLTILQDRRAMELLGEQGHKEALLDLEREYQERLAGIKEQGNQWSLQSTLEGGAQIFGAMGAMNARFLKAQAVFSAGAALISTYQGAAKELEKGTLGFGTAAAVIAKGIGFVAAIKSAGSGGGSSGAASATTSAAPARVEPERVTRIELMGEDWLVNLAESMMDQVYNATGNGRVIISKASA